MNAYDNSCPMCCGDLDDVANLRTGEIVCLSCGFRAERATRAPKLQTSKRSGFGLESHPPPALPRNVQRIK